MTVAELIAKLQELPQDMPVYSYDENRSKFPAVEVKIENAYAWDYETRINKLGHPYIAAIPGTMREIQVVIIE